MRDESGIYVELYVDGGRAWTSARIYITPPWEDEEEPELIEPLEEPDED